LSEAKAFRDNALNEVSAGRLALSS
jgi:hypothetical protein